MLLNLFISIKTIVEKKYSDHLFPKLFAGWALLTFLVSFNGYMGAGLLSEYSKLPCFPHFQSCKSFFEYFNLIPLPYSYYESLFFTVLFGLIIVATYSIYNKKFFITHAILCLLFLVKLFIVSMNYGLGNYDYYDLAIIFIFLIYPLRTDLIKLTFVILYFLASTIKIHEGWILGTYFSSLYYGLPIIPDMLIPVVTNITIVMQIVGCWFLLSNNKKLSTYTLYFFIFFHLYSTILVGYRYPITSLLSLLILFVVNEQKETIERYRLRKKDTAFYLLVAILFVGQSISYYIPGDQKLTLEGNNYGLYMFEANHQCISTITTNNKEVVTASYDARERCDPYIYLSSLKNIYCTSSASTAHWTFDHSINGNPFRRIINSSNLCALEYTPFKHNTWIHKDDQATIVGSAYKNLYLAKDGKTSEAIKNNGYIYSSMLSKSLPAMKTPLQRFLEQHIQAIIQLYWLLWFLTLIYILTKFAHNTLTLSKENTHTK